MEAATWRRGEFLAADFHEKVKILKINLRVCLIYEQIWFRTCLKISTLIYWCRRRHLGRLSSSSPRAAAAHLSREVQSVRAWLWWWNGGCLWSALVRWKQLLIKMFTTAFHHSGSRPSRQVFQYIFKLGKDGEASVWLDPRNCRAFKDANRCSAVSASMLGR